MNAGPVLRDRQCDHPVALCGICSGETYREDIMYLWEGRYICASCMEEKFDVLTVGKRPRCSARGQRRRRFCPERCDGGALFEKNALNGA
jgi:hypothetical protein